MINFDNLRGQWNETLRIERGYTQVDTLPLECHVGYDEKLRRTLLILCRVETKIPPSSKSVEINQRQLRDGKFSLTLSLLSEDEAAVFVEMCRDLLTCAENSSDEAQALKKFWQRYEHWQNLFAAAKNDLLTPERQRGLIGELLFLREQIQGGRLLVEAVDGWLGALKEHQDFSYGETWYEIKTVTEQADKIRIPSLEQLSLERRGELVVYRLAKTSDGFTLNSLVKEVSQLLEKFQPHKNSRHCCSRRVTSSATNTAKFLIDLMKSCALSSTKTFLACRKNFCRPRLSRRRIR